MIIRPRMQVTFADGSERTVNPNRPALLYRFEIEHHKTKPETWAEVCWLAWQACGGDGEDLASWLDTVEEILTVDQDGNPLTETGQPAEAAPASPGK